MGRLIRTLAALARRTSTRPVVRSTSTGPVLRRTSTGPVVEYRVEVDGEPDPGEVVWGWVPFEDDPAQGKDRPVLLLAHEPGHREGEWIGLMLSSRDHTREPGGGARSGRVWMDVGTGAWDRERRPSEVRLDRLVRLPDSAIRREGAALPRPIFESVVARAREFHDLG